MRTSTVRAALALGLLLAACAPAPSDAGPPVVRATAQGDGNSVETTVAGRDLMLDVWSNRGIGDVTVELVAGPAPASVSLRLHLRAMEELRLSYGQTTIVAALASGPGHALTQRSVAPDGAEQPLDPAGPGWLAIELVAPAPDPPFPLRDGHIAVALPQDVLREGGDAFTIQWIDFFR